MEIVLEVKDIHKRFPGVYAIKSVDFQLYKGEIHALMGENGAGKSTLIKILAGVYDYEKGKVFFESSEVNFKTPMDAIRMGISVIYQELNLCRNLSIAENIFFGRLPASKSGHIHWNLLYKNTGEVLDELGFNIDPKTRVEKLSTAQQQLVEIGKAVSYKSKVIIMDEPTSALSPKEIENLFGIIRKLKQKGVGIIYVSHKIDEIFKLSDRVTVFRDGQRIGTEETNKLDKDTLIRMMVGREIKDMYSRTTSNIGEKILEVENLSNDKLSDVSFYARKGEIVGFSGLMGAGRTELAKAIYGFDKRNAGRILIEGKELKPNATWEAKRQGIGYMPEDRKHEGIFGYLSVTKNTTIASESELSNSGRIQFGKQRALVEEIIKKLYIRTPSAAQLVEKLSGGNQQKVILGRWLINKNIKVLIIDEPTRGIDVGAKFEIYNILDKLSHDGIAIIIMSSEMPEILSMCDRIYIMKSGKITGELEREEANPEKLLNYAIM